MTLMIRETLKAEIPFTGLPAFFDMLTDYKRAWPESRFVLLLANPPRTLEEAQAALAALRQQVPPWVTITLGDLPAEEPV